MERLIKVGEIKINTTMPYEDCTNCPAITGEMAVFLMAIGKEKPFTSNLTAQVECHAGFSGKRGKRNSRHMNIILNSVEEREEADKKVRD